MTLKHWFLFAFVALASLAIGQGTTAPATLNIAQGPLFARTSLPPLNMLVMGKDHKIYFQAYNDASDLDGDGILDVGYKGWVLKTGTVPPGTSVYKIDYYGYFNSYACYSWNGDAFTPVSAAPSKTCGGTTWSGDFLNYLTTSRMDALRKVLFGGYRKTDSTSNTILEGSFFPQDGHSFGKEYQSLARDGYDIAQYAPLTQPAAGKYHLFAVTTTQDFASTGYNGPLFRVLQNTPVRIWNWLSIEAPVAGNKCFGAGNTRVDCTSGTQLAFPGHPGSRSEFDTLENNYAINPYLLSTTAPSSINCLTSPCTPYTAQTNNYLAIFEGRIFVPQGDTYQFAVDGDDAVDVLITKDNGDAISNGTAGFYGGHGVCTCTTYNTGDMSLNGGTFYRVKFRMEQGTGDDKFVLRIRRKNGNSNNYNTSILDAYSLLNPAQPGFTALTMKVYNLTPTVGNATRQDYRVRVQVCTADDAVRDNTCKAYPNGQYKPTGILHDYGETDRMYFGLITGSQNNNIQGGKLRRNMTSFSSEIDANTGQFNTTVGIARTISNLRMIGGAYGGGVTNNYLGDTGFNWGNGTGNCGGSEQPVSNGNCRMWGNPIAEMMYESLRYFAGAGAATPQFVAATSANGVAEETAMGLGTEVWQDPYRTTTGGFPSCAKPFQTVISDINPSYDGDLPGSGFSDAITPTGATPAKISGFSAQTEGQTIWNQQFSGPQNVFIGESGGTSDGAPTPKAASSFGNIRGLSPEEPTKGGTYYAASVARFGHVNDISAANNDQKLSTYAIALASPLPRIEFGGVTVIPFGKTVSGTFGGSARKPTNTIVSLYVEQIINLNGVEDATVNGGRPSASFRVSYEDVEQGNDFDMDAIVRYQVVQNADNTVTITLLSEYAAGSANQNMGYIISGTTKDGVYLEVRDSDSGIGTSVYSLNTPAGVDAGGCVGATGSAPCNAGLTLNATRTFTRSSAAPGVQLQDPLWYAAKFGGFPDDNKDGIPQTAEWDANGDGTPDNYFLVTNPLNLRAQLTKAFDAIQAQNGPSGSLALAGTRIGTDSFTVAPSYASSNNGHDWVGDLEAYGINSDGQRGTKLWSAAARLPTTSAGVDARKIYTAIGTVNNVVRTNVVEFRAANLGLTDIGRYARLGYTPADVLNLFGVVAADDMVKYLRGDKSKEGTTKTTTPFRPRTGPLGDIVNSSPVISRPSDNYGWAYASGVNPARRTAYSAYLTSKATSGRGNYAFVGANDGMLHGFNAVGDEKFAYIPNGVLGRMGRLADPEYAHLYYVDGQQVVADAPNGTADAAPWRTVLVGSAGAGAKSVYGLNVTSPGTFDANSVLWEFNSTTDSDDLGYVLGKPVIVPVKDGSVTRWVALFGNGYNSTNSNAVLFVVDVNTGALLKKIVANDNDNVNANGLGNIAAIDNNGDGLVDTVYGGDLLGNVWKFDLSASTFASYQVALSGAPLFVATVNGSNNRQPITGGIVAAAGPGTGIMLYFGTGKYFETNDNNSNTGQDVQSLYAIWDNGTTAITGVGVGNPRTRLVRQVITSTNPTSTAPRTVSYSPVTYVTDRGWVMDLVLTGQTGSGERYIAFPQLFNGLVLFTAYAPGFASDCVPGGKNWDYYLGALSGAPAASSVSTNSDLSNPAGGTGTAGLAGSDGAPNINQGVGVLQNTPGAGFTGGPCLPGSSGCVAPTEADVSGLYKQCTLVIQGSASAPVYVPRACGRQSWRQIL